jgi:hypothetical protein
MRSTRKLRVTVRESLTNNTRKGRTDRTAVVEVEDFDMIDAPYASLAKTAGKTHYQVPTEVLIALEAYLSNWMSTHNHTPSYIRPMMSRLTNAVDKARGLASDVVDFDILEAMYFFLSEQANSNSFGWGRDTHAAMNWLRNWFNHDYTASKKTASSDVPRELPLAWAKYMAGADGTINSLESVARETSQGRFDGWLLKTTAGDGQKDTYFFWRNLDGILGANGALYLENMSMGGSGDYRVDEVGPGVWNVPGWTFGGGVTLTASKKTAGNTYRVVYFDAEEGINPAGWAVDMVSDRYDQYPHWTSQMWDTEAEADEWARTNYGGTNRIASKTAADSIKQVLMNRDGYSAEEAETVIEQARQAIEEGADPEQVLMDEFGLEADYMDELL